MCCQQQSLCWRPFHDLPSETSELANTCASSRQGHANQCLAECVRRPKHDATHAEAGRSEDCDVSLPEQVLQVANEWADRSNRKRVRNRQPTDSISRAYIGSNERQRATSEV